MNYNQSFFISQKRSSLASFSACGGSLLRQNSLPTHGHPRGAFLCHRTHFPMTQKRPTSSVSLPFIPLIFPIICSAAFPVLPPMRKMGTFTGLTVQSKQPHTPCPSQSAPSTLPEKQISAPDAQSSEAEPQSLFHTDFLPAP